MNKEDRKLETKLERHKVHSELKKVVDQKEDDIEETTITAYQNKNNQGWVKIEIPWKKKKI